MANPINEKGLMADGNGNPLISARQALVSDMSVTTDLTGVDTGTDMTAAQAGQIETDLASAATAINAILDVLEAHGLMADA